MKETQENTPGLKARENDINERVRGMQKWRMKI